MQYINEDQIINLVENSNLLESLLTHYDAEILLSAIKEKVRPDLVSRTFGNEEWLAESILNFQGNNCEFQTALEGYDSFHEVLFSPNENMRCNFKTLGTEWLLENTDTDLVDIIDTIKQYNTSNFDVQDFVKQVLENPERAMIPNR